ARPVGAADDPDPVAAGPARPDRHPPGRGLGPPRRRRADDAAGRLRPLRTGGTPGGRRRRSTLAAMVVKINAIEVAEGRGPELEQRFAARAREVDNQPGFLGFELLRPVKGETRYFVVTHWESDAA